MSLSIFTNLSSQRKKATAGPTTLPQSSFMKAKKFELRTQGETVASYNATYDGYLQFCDDMGNEPYEEDSAEFFEWMNIAKGEGGCYID